MDSSIDPPFAVFARSPDAITRDFDGVDLMPCRYGTMIRRIGFITRAPVIRRNVGIVWRSLSPAIRSLLPCIEFFLLIFNAYLRKADGIRIGPLARKARIVPCRRRNPAAFRPHERPLDTRAFPISMAAGARMRGDNEDRGKGSDEGTGPRPGNRMAAGGVHADHRREYTVRHRREGGDFSVSGSLSPDPALSFRPLAGTPGAVLLETQRPEVRERYSYLFGDPARVLVCAEPGRVQGLLSEAGDWQARGFAVAGFIAYEAGFALDPAFGNETVPHDPSFPLLWFGVYPGYLRYDHLTGRRERFGHLSVPRIPPLAEALPMTATGEVPHPVFSLSEEDHREKVEEIRLNIREGNVYQANLTGSFSFPFDGNPFDLYLRLRAVQPVPFGAFLRTEDGAIVSQSPELFFRVRGGRIEVRPMKGTAPRGLTEGEDRRLAAALKKDPKNRAENAMIVDLLRNDLGRVCEPGSVRVRRSFEVQRYRTVLQMVSTVTGRMKSCETFASLVRALFPCGSVTGAPKISAMRLLRRLEPFPRGVYTGAIGALLPGGDMSFSVAIRTVTVREGRARAGAGGGIVWDSRPGEEFQEVLQKSRYLIEPADDFCLIETFLWSPGEGFRFLSDHLRRLSSSARYFGFRFRRETVLAALNRAAGSRGTPEAGPGKVRLLLGKEGDVTVEISPVPVPPPGGETEPLRVALSGVAVSSRDPFTRHKTTNRGLRDAELRRARDAGYDEILFLNERGELAEGAITNVFLEISGRLVTPPLSSGLLDGVFRRHVLKDRTVQAAERVLYPEDLRRADRIFLTNSVRGIAPARIPSPGLEASGEEARRRA